MQKAWVLLYPFWCTVKIKSASIGLKMGNLIQLQGCVQGRRVRQKRIGTSLSAYMVCAKRLVALGTELVLTHNDSIDLALE